jgi:hypothetical protein
MPAIFVDGDPETQKPGANLAAEFADAVTASLSEAVHLLLAESDVRTTD